jgi:hypothetical protein
MGLTFRIADRSAFRETMLQSASLDALAGLDRGFERMSELAQADVDVFLRCREFLGRQRGRLYNTAFAAGARSCGRRCRRWQTGVAGRRAHPHHRAGQAWRDRCARPVVQTPRRMLNRRGHLDQQVKVASRGIVAKARAEDPRLNRRSGGVAYDASDRLDLFGGQANGGSVLQEPGGRQSAEMARRYAHLAPEHLAEHAERTETAIRTVSGTADMKKAS